MNHIKEVYTLEYRGKTVVIGAKYESKGDYAYDSFYSEIAGNYIPKITFYELAENTRDFSHEMNRLRTRCVF